MHRRCKVKLHFDSSINVLSYYLMSLIMTTHDLRFKTIRWCGKTLLVEQLY